MHIWTTWYTLNGEIVLEGINKALDLPLLGYATLSLSKRDYILFYKWYIFTAVIQKILAFSTQQVSQCQISYQSLCCLYWYHFTPGTVPWACFHLISWQTLDVFWNLDRPLWCCGQSVLFFIFLRIIAVWFFFLLTSTAMDQMEWCMKGDGNRRVFQISPWRLKPFPITISGKTAGPLAVSFYALNSYA